MNIIYYSASANHTNQGAYDLHQLASAAAAVINQSTLSSNHNMPRTSMNANVPRSSSVQPSAFIPIRSTTPTINDHIHTARCAKRSADNNHIDHRRKRKITVPADYSSDDSIQADLDSPEEVFPIIPVTANNVTARQVLETTRTHIQHELDQDVLQQALNSTQYNMEHINNRNQPIPLTTNALVMRASARRPRGEAFNSYKAAQDELQPMQRFMQSNVLPQITEGKIEKSISIFKNLLEIL